MELPSVGEFPEGPRRTFLEGLHALYREADRPSVRMISHGLSEGDFRATMNRDLVSKVLNGRVWPTLWQAESLARWLGERAMGVDDVENEVGEHLKRYRTAEFDGTLRSSPPSISRARISIGDDPIGAGVVLRDGRVLTAKFVVDVITKESETIRVHSIDHKVEFHADLAWTSSSDLDGLAVLQPVGVSIGRPYASWKNPTEGERVRIYGFPEFGGLWKTGTVVGPRSEDGSWQLEIPSTENGWGFGGAAVYSDSGFALGLFQGGPSIDSFAWMTPLSEISRITPDWPN
ncbi:hypothetical protein ACIRPH_10255 [Nocardiopsis sp. NPDC101807]|uniref:hypothetical protein n=1 Tax=Nocardiopsis sp. NPDC101807 TaxID=3364339 RepID=UPI0038224124